MTNILVGFLVGWLGSGFVMGLIRVPPVFAHKASFAIGVVCAAINFFAS